MIDYDLLVIGAGSGGYVTAIRAAQLGGKVALIEKAEIGGTCLNRGCIPTKALLASGRMIEEIKRARELGILVDSYQVDFPAIIQRKDQVVKELVQGIEFLLKKNKVSLLKGKASLKDRNCVLVEDETGSKELKTSNIVIATGSEPLLLPDFNYDGINVITSKEALNFSSLPKEIVIIGGGYIGAEFASIFSSLGVRVTIVELLKGILATEDRSTAKKMERIFLEKGIALKTNTGVELVEIKEKSAGEGTNVIIHLNTGEIIETEKVLIAIGRRPVTRDLGLEEIGVKIDEKGFIVVNERMETNIPGIYAVGDVTGKIMLAHVASTQGIVAAENIMNKDSIMDYSSVPSVIFTNPEIAKTGLSYQEARKAGYKVKRGRFSYRANGKAKAMGLQEGMVTLISEEKSGQILGGEIFGVGAENLIGEISLAVKNGLTAEKIAKTIHPHPTLTEMIMEAAEELIY